MYIIKDPSVGISAAELLKLCANSYRDKDLKARLLGYMEKIERHAQENPGRIPFDIGAFLDEILPEQVSQEDMKKVYEEKLAKKRAKGRGYYDAILDLAPHRRCPICGVQRAETLDHYLPKSKVPTLALDPGNLIPACERCNKRKGDLLEKDPHKMPVHTYYDRIPEGKWLHVTLGDHLEAAYYTKCPDTEEWESGIRSRVGRHLEIYDLEELYSDEAAVLLANMRNSWTTELRYLRKYAGAELSNEEMCEEFKEFVTKRREECEMGDENSFESAFYRGLEENMETAYAFFGLKEYAYAE